MTRGLKFTDYGDVIITEENDPDKIIDQIMEKHNEVEGGVGFGFSAQFISKAMFAGFYLTSSGDPEFLPNKCNEEKIIPHPLYNIWKTQTVLFFDRLHESKSVVKLLKNYELRINFNLERIIDECIKAHGDIWVLPLKKTLLEINKNKYNNVDILSFELYKDNILKAGEFGVKTGKIYTSYSGFHNENSAGSVQLLMMLRYLRDKNFVLCNFGTDDSKKNNAYKRRLGAEYIDRRLFIKLWREARAL